MPTLPITAAVSAEEDLVLPIPLRDGTTKEYRIAPCTAGELLDLLALDKLWAAVGRQMYLRQAKELSPEESARLATPDKGMQARLIRLMKSELTAEDIIALPLGPVAEQMLADGVGKQHYLLASMTAMYWHIAGDQAAMDVWVSGREPGKPAAPPKKSSTSTGGAARRPARSRGTGSRRK